MVCALTNTLSKSREQINCKYPRGMRSEVAQSLGVLGYET